MGSKQYVDEAINNVEKWLSDRGMYLKRKSAKSVLPSSYRTELDDTKYLDQEHVSYYQEQIGVLRWMVELGRVDICYTVVHSDPPTLDWSDFYKDAQDIIPPDMPEPLGEPVQLNVFVDSDHAGDTVTRRSRTDRKSTRLNSSH